MMPDDGWIDELLLQLKDMLLFSFFLWPDKDHLSFCLCSGLF
jgi:hypothetical protein